MQPSAVIIGDVIIGHGVYVALCALLRGVLGRIVIGAGANIQDGVVVHGFAHTETTIEENGHIGHGTMPAPCGAMSWSA